MKSIFLSFCHTTSNELTFSVSSRLTGIRPVFSLMTSDGAILSEEDPLSLVLSSPELKTCVTNWKASPAEERYLECCEALGICKWRSGHFRNLLSLIFTYNIW